MHWKKYHKVPFKNGFLLLIEQLPVEIFRWWSIIEQMHFYIGLLWWVYFLLTRCSSRKKRNCQRIRMVIQAHPFGSVAFTIHQLTPIHLALPHTKWRIYCPLPFKFLVSHMWKKLLATEIIQSYHFSPSPELGKIITSLSFSKRNGF